MPSFKPSQVKPCERFRPTRGTTFVPFMSAMGRLEREFTAALIVRVCEARNDEWAPVSFADGQRIMKADFDAGRKPWADWLKSPFYRTDAFDLVRHGYAKWTGEEGGLLEFTEKGFVALADFVDPNDCECIDCSISGEPTH